MILTFFIISAFIYAFLVGFAYSQVKKILKKYSKYPHLQNLPQQWQGFIRKDKHNWKQSQLLIGCFLRFPFKFFLFVQYTLGCFFFILITLPLGSDFCNKFLKYYGRYYGSFLYKLIYKTEQPQDLNKKIIKTPILISNHVCWYDTMYLIVKFYPISFLAKEQIGRIPVIKTIVNNAQSIYIERDNPQSRNNIVEKIKERINNFLAKSKLNQFQKVNPLIIFPQGTTSNGNALLKFKLGAFSDLAPITIVSLNYTSDNFDVGMVQITQLQHIILSFCLKVKLTVKINEIQAKLNQTPEDYSKRAQKQLSKMTGFKIYNSGFRERNQHQKMIKEQIQKLKEKTL